MSVDESNSESSVAATANRRHGAPIDDGNFKDIIGAAVFSS